MERAGEFTVGGVNFVGGGRRGNGEEGVECGIGAFGSDDLIAETEDFVVLFIGESC